MTESKKNLTRKLARERNARLQAERLLEEKSDELYATLQRVQASENMLSSALRNMANGLLLTTDHHVVMLANQRLRAVYPNYADVLVEGSNLTGKFKPLFEHPEYLTVVQGHDKETSFEIEFAPDKTVAIGVRYTREGFIASTHLDITEIRKSELERQQLLMELMSAQRLQAIGRMSGLIAHDFNNIVASIKGYAGFLHEDMAPGDENHRSIERILSSTQKAEDLIKGILQYGHQRQVGHQQVSLIPVIEDCLEMLAPSFSTSIKVTFDPPETPIWVNADEFRLSRLFVNLLMNTQRAMSDNNGELVVLVESFDSLEMGSETCKHSKLDFKKAFSAKVGVERYVIPCVRVSFLDNGSGMGQEVIERCFEPYFSTREKGESGGLGLASVADIVMDFAGTVKLTSQVGVGTITEVVFPCIESMWDYSKTGVKHKADHRDFKIMIIEDDVNVGEMIKLTLQRDGLAAEVFHDPVAALESLSEQPQAWSLVVSDQLMPQMKGTDIYQSLLQNGISIPFILCSAQIDPESLVIASGMSENFVTKPIDKAELIKKVRSFM